MCVADPAAIEPDEEKKPDGRSTNKGARTRKRYSFAFKSEVLEEVEQALLRGETANSVADEYGLHESTISSWRQATADIHGAATSKRLKKLTAKPGAGRPSRWVEMEKRLKEDITAYRRARATLGPLISEGKLRRYVDTTMQQHARLVYTRAVAMWSHYTMYATIMYEGKRSTAISPAPR